MEQFRAEVANIFEEGSAEKMILFLEHCWLDRLRGARKPSPHTGTADKFPSKRDPGQTTEPENLQGQSGGPFPEWDPLVLWVCPSRHLLDTIALQVRGAGLCAVTSLGSGTGLLEWLLHQSSGLEVTSLEVNRSWWESSYAPPTFVRHVYTDELHTDAEERSDVEVYEVPPTDAFMTCYFNNADVFSKYLARYEGPLMLIIGSEEGSVATRPAPLDYAQHQHWRLCHTVSLGPVAGHNLLAVYVRRSNS